MPARTPLLLLTATLWSALTLPGQVLVQEELPNSNSSVPIAKNVIFFVGDGMGISTITATRIYSVGIDGRLAMDKLPFSALSRTYTSDHITPDSAATMTAMMTGNNTNSGVVGLNEKTERGDFNKNGDGPALTTLLEIAKAAGKRIGIVTTARVTDATPAACYAKVHDRDLENDVALQATPKDKTFNKALGTGIDLLVGGGRRHFVPSTLNDEEGAPGRRTDTRDLRAEFRAAGYRYVWEKTGWNGLKAGDLPVLGLFESSHMEYEFDRPKDSGGEPSLTDMVRKSLTLLKHNNDKGYFLVVEGGRIDQAHHAGNAWRAVMETEEFDEALEAALFTVDLRDTLIVVTADHSHAFNIVGYPLRQPNELPYNVKKFPTTWRSPYGGIFNTVFGLDPATGDVAEVGDINKTPFAVLGYYNGSGYRGVARVSPRSDPFKGYNGSTVTGPDDPNYLQEAAVPLSAATHSGEDVGIFAIGPGSALLRGNKKNTFIFDLIRAAIGQ